MRADAKKNYDHLLAVARAAVIENGADASLRDIARRAGVGLATLYRHFPTRDALLETLLQDALSIVIKKADEIEHTTTPDDALLTWFHEGVTFVRSYSGVVDLMAAAIADPDSALHTSCVTVRSAGTRLLKRAQADGTARTDIDGDDLFALMAALAWLGNQSSFKARVDHLSAIIADAVLAPGSTAICRNLLHSAETSNLA